MYLKLFSRRTGAAETNGFSELILQPPPSLLSVIFNKCSDFTTLLMSPKSYRHDSSNFSFDRKVRWQTERCP